MQNRTIVLKHKVYVFKMWNIKLHQPCYSIKRKCFHYGDISQRDNEMSQWIHDLHYLSVLKNCYPPWTTARSSYFLKKPFCCKTHYITWGRYLTSQNSLGSDPNSNVFDTGLGGVTINQDHPWLEGQVWRKRQGVRGGLGRGWTREAERGKEWPWIKLWCRDAVQWAAVAERYKAYDRCSSWKHITALGLKPSKFFQSVEGNT